VYLAFSLAETHAHLVTAAIEVNNHFICTSAFPNQTLGRVTKIRGMNKDVSVLSGSSIYSLFEVMNYMKRCKFFAIDPLCPIKEVTVSIG